MKKTISLLLTAVMLLGMIAAMGFSASAADGDVLYTVDFTGNDGVYKPWNFRNGNAAMAATTIEVGDNGRTLTGTVPADTAAAYFYGGAFSGFELGVDKKYTMTMKVAFPTGNAGVYFNFGDPSGDPLQDSTYNYLYGVYGQIKANPAACMTMSIAAGGKCTGELVSNAGRYTPVPVGVENDGSGFVDVRFEIDGLFYSVFFNDILYDQMWMNEDVLVKAPHLGFTLYLYNKSASATVKDVVVKQGCSYGQDNSTKKYTALDYNKFLDGDKMLDITFNATEGPFQAHVVQDSKPEAVDITVSDDGKSVAMFDLEGSNAHWFGDIIHGLKVGDGFKYTFVFKNKDEGSKTVGCVAFNAMESAWANGERFNWYGSFTNGGAPYLKFARNGTNLAAYNYPGNASGGENMKAFDNIIPAVDADGFTQICVELDGWNWTIYLIDSVTNQQVAAQTINVKEAAAAENLTAEKSDELAFVLYTYNANLILTVKDAVLYKGLVASEHAVMETSAPTEAPTAAPTEAPTAAPTDAPTEAPTDAPTEAPANTDAPETKPAEEKKGCKSSVACGLVVLAVFGTAYVSKRKF